MIIKAIVFIVALAFTSLGLAEFIHITKLRFNRPQTKAVTYSVVFLNGEEPEQQLFYAAEQKLWMGDTYADFIVAVNTGLSEKEDTACRFIADKCGINYCTVEELFEEFGEYLPLENK